jgi:hypothetical protein
VQQHGGKKNKIRPDMNGTDRKRFAVPPGFRLSPTP